MKFGTVPVQEACGCILAHSLKLQTGVLKKGRRLVDADIAGLLAAGVRELVVARLGEDDVHEDEAAARMARALAGAQVTCGPAVTGRVNLVARRAGLALVDSARIHAVNAVHESLTVATLAPYEPVVEGQMLATIKIIPYAAPRAALARVLAVSQGVSAAISVAPFCGLAVGLILTRLPDTRAAVLAKMRSAVHKRLLPLDARLIEERVVAHQIGALASVLQEVAALPRVDAVLISGIAATVDRADVVPAAIALAGGTVLHAGMPVDPGNLLLLGSLAREDRHCAVVGIPTCARSPKLNGFDFVLRRLAAGIDVSGPDIAAMGVGGLLSEIPTRPMPRGGS